ncbi:MAG TPA: hypothetical protein VI916_09105, partial [Acidimicrobiia bacterium]|nr:hypothetical protein [Acidimicrobiia bacterium]
NTELPAPDAVASRRRRLPTPSPQAGRVLRTLTLLTFVAAAFLAIRLFVPSDDVGRQEPTYEDGELSVADAISIARGDPLAVRGYVFAGPGARELRLCNSREGSDPPRCIGPFLSLYGVDAGAFGMREDTDDAEGPLRFSPEEVLVTGPVNGTAMTVQVVLGT